MEGPVKMAMLGDSEGEECGPVSSRQRVLDSRDNRSLLYCYASESEPFLTWEERHRPVCLIQRRQATGSRPLHASPALVGNLPRLPPLSLTIDQQFLRQRLTTSSDRRRTVIIAHGNPYSRETQPSY
jgi:hypothetical protein